MTAADIYGALMPNISAEAGVTAVLLALREDDPALFALVLRRLRLLMMDPGHPRARGATFRTKEGQSVHVVEVGHDTRSLGLVWALAGNEIRLLALDEIN